MSSFNHKPVHFLQLSDLSIEEIVYLFERTRVLKRKQIEGEWYQPLVGKTMAMIFEKPSTRTRLSFSSGMFQLGGLAINLVGSEMQIKRGESIADTGRVVSSMADIVMMRTYQHERITTLAEHSRVSVINGLTDSYHPCQVLTDLYTYLEWNDKISESASYLRNKRIAWVGDGNNMANTWLQAASLFGFVCVVSTPESHRVDPSYLAGLSPGCYEWFKDPAQACYQADVVNTDSWVSMGNDAETHERRQIFKDWSINLALMKLAKEDAIFMHCLPAHRGEEVQNEVIDSRQSAVWQQAENRLHLQKALIEYLLLGRQ
ncbi:MAG: ornithine carbamoyltransferase [Gammaproteobacteria bacterium]|nr:ornithine carbamoyltransferase [Gammaproteobacteria bacterium]